MTAFDTITNKWKATQKKYGFSDVLTIPNGEQVAGRYVLVPSGSCTPSHNALEGFTMSAGFPTDENGNSVNDRDYMRDTDAQEITRTIARNYDARAIQCAVIVSPDGVVLSGNGRTMAGELAAHYGTDGAYIAYLRDHVAKYGLSVEDVTIFEHPRILFELSEVMPYNAATFAKFNQQEGKTMNKTEQAVKLGKLVDAETFGRIIATINAFDTLGDFYANTEASTRCLNDLRNVGVIDSMSYAQMFDGDTISANGRELLENVLIGKAFAGNPDAARQITTFKSLRKSVIFALSEVANNLTLSEDYTLTNDLTKAVQLAYNARKSGYKAGERVSIFARQTEIFSEEAKESYTDTQTTIADLLNDERVTMLKKYLTIYNQNAQSASNGQTDMFCENGVKTKEDILQDVKTLFATGTAKEQENAVNGATEQRTSNNIFLTDEQLTTLAKGGFCEYTLPHGGTIICQISDIANTIIYLIAKGGTKFWANAHSCAPSASHNATLPEWLKSGQLITDGELIQRIASVNGNTINLDWINGGYFDIDLATVLTKWQPAA